MRGPSFIGPFSLAKRGVGQKHFLPYVIRPKYGGPTKSMNLSEYSIISLENHSLPTFIVCEKVHIADEDQKFYMYVDKPLRRQGNLIPHFHIHFLSPSRFLEI